MDPHYAGSAVDTYVPNTLFATSNDIEAEKITIPQGHAAMELGSVLGQITLGAVSAAASGGNVGAGTLTLDADTPKLSGAKQGDYSVVCIGEAVNGGVFQVTDPDGIVIGQASIAEGGAFANQIKFVIADDGEDFDIGDTFTVTIAAGSGDHVLSLAAATDGSQVPDKILGENTPEVEDVGGLEAMSYIKGTVRAEALKLGTGHTLDSVKDGLRQRGVFIK